MRVDAMSRITEACIVYELPAPKSVEANWCTVPALHIQLDDDKPEQVDAWAAFLGLGPTADVPIAGGSYVAHQVDLWDHDSTEGVWRGWRRVYVWCSVHPKAGA
jgi:hypothetical protein